MVISRQYRYIFVEIPLTGSWAIRNELIEFYGGQSILHKHANYEEFARQATVDQKDYFVFATVRNPLDEAVSRYFKLKTDHQGAFTDPEAMTALKSDAADQQKYAYVHEQEATFESYFRQYHRRPFNNLLALSESRLDFVMRFEDLQAGFRQALNHLGLNIVRPVPVQNKTAQRREDWRTYYTPEIIAPATRNFGPFMRKWDYAFPEEWGEHDVDWSSVVLFRVWSAGQKAYVRHFRYNDNVVGKLGRAIKARLVG
jgi:hypothetical protein